MIARRLQLSMRTLASRLSANFPAIRLLGRQSGGRREPTVATVSTRTRPQEPSNLHRVPWLPLRIEPNL